jgi:hypothetical protein
MVAVLLPPRSNDKPEAATAVDKLLMMGMRMPETCWIVFKRQVIKLRNWCIWLVDLFEYMMMHGLTNPKFVWLLYILSIRQGQPIGTCNYAFTTYEPTQSLHESDNIHRKLSVRDPRINSPICMPCAGVKRFLPPHNWTDQGSEILKCHKYQYSYFDMMDLRINNIAIANLSAL